MSALSSIYFDIVEKKRSRTYKILYALFLLLFLALFGSILYDENTNPPRLRNMVLLVCLLLVILAIIFRSFKVKEFQKIGRIHLKTDKIAILTSEHSMEFALADLKPIQLNINDTSEDTQFTSSIWAFKNKEGINNFIEFTEENGVTHRYRIYIEGISSLRVLNRFLNNWNGINYKLLGSRSDIKNY